MLHIIATIAPIFAIILLGLLLRRFDFLHEAFFKMANRLAYYVAISAMMVWYVKKRRVTAGWP